MKLLAITSCPNGIAHTYMAAENLANTAKEMGIEIKVETQGSIGVENELSAEEIETADGIIIAADKTVDLDRFQGKRLIYTGVGEAIHKPKELIERFQKGTVEVYGEKKLKTIEQVKGERKAGQGVFYRSLMNGVSYMIPFVVVGGLLIALSLSLGGVPTPQGLAIPPGSIWQSLLNVGSAAFTFMIPILAGYIAVSIADRPGLAPGMIGGYIAANGSFYGSVAGAGFIGGIAAGFLAGYTARAVKSLRVPRVIQPIMPILVIPLLSSLVVAAIFIFGIGAPIAQLMTGLMNFLNTMRGASSIVLAAILGAMIAFDMGGPVNKVAFLFGASMIGQGNAAVMGAIATAICIPPLGMGLATLLREKKYTREESEAGKAALAMGLVGITEGAIPFAARDPFRVIPSIMVGSMVGAIIAMLGGVTDNVPHGGPIVALFQAVGNWLMFFVAIIVGVVVTALLVNALKRPVAK